MSRVAVIIPCYNEEKTIGNVIDSIKEKIPNCQVFVGDNNSTDNTVKISLEHQAIVKKIPKQGKGNVIRKLFATIDADVYVMIDGDATYDVSKLPEMLSYVESDEYDIVVGNRLATTYFKENKRKFHNTGNRIVNRFINFLFKGNVQDTMSGFRVMSKRFVKSLPILDSGFGIETEMTIYILHKGFALKEVPIKYIDRVEGSYSKLNTFKDGFRVIKLIINLFKEYRPLLFFSLFSLGCFILSIGLFIPVFIAYLKTKLVLKFPTLIVSGVLLTLSLIFFITGLILDSIKTKYNQLTEIINNRYN
ncbi:MAG: glycosyltransferase [Bacilli bacterium]|nr:glycosyltransferase [Bacilli bacterium]MCI9434565.1 glycosyltransferase [Bacilli bacterium]